MLVSVAEFRRRVQGDLFEFIEKSETNCLNQKDEHTWEAMLKVRSDTWGSPVWLYRAPRLRRVAHMNSSL